MPDYGLNARNLPFGAGFVAPNGMNYSDCGNGVLGLSTGILNQPQAVTKANNATITAFRLGNPAQGASITLAVLSEPQTATQRFILYKTANQVAAPGVAFRTAEPYLNRTNQTAQIGAKGIGVTN